MNRMLSKDELSRVSSKFWLTKQEKLKRLAKIVREYPIWVQMVGRLEFCSDDELKRWAPQAATAMGIAAHDPVFIDAGVKPDGSGYDTIKFLELTKHELHTFSCDCHGSLTNAEMADRIEALAATA